MSCVVQSADRVVHTQQDVLETISRSIIETDKQHRDQLDTINQRFAERRQEIAKLTQEKRWGHGSHRQLHTRLGYRHLAAATQGPWS